MEDRVCKRCVMSTKGDSSIIFDENGYCNYCTDTLKVINDVYFPNEEGEKKIHDIIEEIKEKSKNTKYDCIMGISGGLDSSYLMMLGAKWGLRILAIHLNDGFDTEISRRNIQKLINKVGCDYLEVTPDSDQFAAINKAYMKAGVPNLAVAQDNMIFAEIHHQMKIKKIKFFLSGFNYSTECILQKGNTHSAYDTVQLRDIFRKHGNGRIDKLRLMSNTRYLWDQFIINYKTICPLNYVDYNRDRAFIELKDFCGFEYYGRKHLENVFTAFLQLYWLPKKFNVDKRTSHLSSMIVTGQLTREEALSELNEPIYDEQMMNEYIEIVKRKTNISDIEFKEIMASEPHSHDDYRMESQTITYKVLKTMWSVYKFFRH